MNAFWGDESWRRVSYKPSPLFKEVEEKASNEVIVEAFRKRLQDVAGFKRVPGPLPMPNSRGAVVYYLFFASQKEVAQGIAEEIFKKELERRAVRIRAEIT